VERHRAGSVSEIVIVDVASKATRAIVPSALGRSVTPVWRPDGQAIVAAVAGEERPFNLFEFPIDGGSPRQLTTMSGGAKWPDISADGKTIVFVGYTVDGFDLFTMPYPTSSGADTSVGPYVAGLRDRAAESDPVVGADLRVRPGDRSDGTAVDYSPWPTLRPTSWTPIVESDSTQ